MLNYVDMKCYVAVFGGRTAAVAMRNWPLQFNSIVGIGQRLANFVDDNLPIKINVIFIKES